MRIQNTLKNGAVAMLSQLVIIITGFILRAYFINALGQEYLGLNGLFVDILSILSVTELGIGSAITFSMYKPIYENDIETVTGLMNLYRKAYRIIGTIIFGASILILPFIQIFIKDYTLDLNYIRFIFMMFSVNTVLSYYLGYSRIILFAKQKNYIVLLIDFIFKIILTTSQIFVLIYTKDFILYLSLTIGYTIVSNLIVRHISFKQNPFLHDTKTKVSIEMRKKIFNSIKYLSISSIISVGVFGTDRLIISSLIGITILGVYSNYSMIIQQVQTLFVSFLNGVVASLGNLIAEGNSKKIQDIYYIYHFSYFLIASFTSIALYVLLTPFIVDIWLNVEYIMSDVIVAIIVFNSYLFFMRQPVWQSQTTAGIFKQFIPFSVVEFVISLTVSIIGAIQFGIIGIFLGKTIAYLVSWIGQAYILNKHVIHDKVSKIYRKQFEYMFVTFVELFVCIFLIRFITINHSVIAFILKGSLIFIVTSSINIALYYRTFEFSYLRNSVLNKILKK